MEQVIRHRGVKSKKPKTQGLEWLCLSFTAFNGSGYQDMSTPEAFVQSYIDYNAWKNRKDAVELAIEYKEELYNLACHLIESSSGAGREPSKKGLKKFNEFKNKQSELSKPKCLFF